MTETKKLFWINDHLSLFTCERTGKELHGSVMLITRYTRVNPWMYSYVWRQITDGYHWWKIGITFIKRLDPKILLPHRYQIMRLMNKIIILIIYKKTKSYFQMNIPLNIMYIQQNTNSFLLYINFANLLYRFMNTTIIFLLYLLSSKIILVFLL